MAMESKSLEYINDTSIDTYTTLANDFENRLESQVRILVIFMRTVVAL